MQPLTKPKLAKHFKNNHALDEMMIAFEPFIEFISVKSKVDVCRDKNDNFLLALAKDGKANFLITGDKDLLILENFYKAKILTINDFLKEILTKN